MPLVLTDLLSRGSPVEGRLDESVPVGNFPRLAESLLDAGGSVRVDVRVSRTASGVPLIEGRVGGRFTRQCQRCLEPVEIDLQVDLRLAVIESDGAEPAPAGFEPWILEGTEVSLRDLMEDELLLGLPMVARHEDPVECPDICGQPGDGAAEEPLAATENPFAVLRKLKLD